MSKKGLCWMVIASLAEKNDYVKAICGKELPEMPNLSLRLAAAVQGLAPFGKPPEFRVSKQWLAICPWNNTAGDPEIQPNASRIDVVKRELVLKFASVAEVALKKRCRET
jgi:hypothetical protein